MSFVFVVPSGIRNHDHTVTGRKAKYHTKDPRTLTYLQFGLIVKLKAFTPIDIFVNNFMSLLNISTGKH